MTTFIETMLQENAIGYRFSDRIFDNAIMWLSARQYISKLEKADTQLRGQVDTSHENEFIVVYHDADSFQRQFCDGTLIRQMTALKQYAVKRPEFKVLILFNSVLDCLFSNEEVGQRTMKKAEADSHYSVTAAQYEAFCVDLTITYEFDYIELITPLEVIEFLKEMHLSIKDKPHRKELSMYSRKGFRPSKRAMLVGGFEDPLTVYFCSWMMAIPGVSENKAVAIAKRYKTIANLMKALSNRELTEKERKAQMQDIQVPSTHLGGKPTKLGKVVAERVFYYFMSVDPNLMVTN